MRGGRPTTPQREYACVPCKGVELEEALDNIESALTDHGSLIRGFRERQLGIIEESDGPFGERFYHCNRTTVFLRYDFQGDFPGDHAEQMEKPSLSFQIYGNTSDIESVMELVATHAKLIEVLPIAEWDAKYLD